MPMSSVERSGPRRMIGADRGDYVGVFGLKFSLLRLYRTP